MFSIGEFSRASGLPIKTLRFYHEKGLLVPEAVDPGSGYRYYSDANLEKARIIVVLRELEFSLEDVGRILNECDEDSEVLTFLERRRAALRDDIRHRRNLVSSLDRIIQKEHEAKKIMQTSSF